MIFGTVRGKIINHSALILLILMSATLYTGFASFNIGDSVSVLFRNNLLLKYLRDTLDKTESNLNVYLTAKSSDALKDYILYSTRLSETSQKLNSEIRNDESLLLQRDLVRITEKYLSETEASVSAKRGRDVQTYSTAYYESVRLAEQIRFLIDQNERVFIADSLTAFSAFRSIIPTTIATNAILVVAASLLGLMLLISYSYKLTEPMTVLAGAARAVGRGDYEAELPATESRDEIGVMANAFSAMRDDVKQAFTELRSKSEVEKKLMEEKLVVLDMEHKLKNAELLALQSQINPHFLYNTLSAGMGIAWSENADRTSKFLDDLAAFIRYALKPAYRTVRVEDEIECVTRYINLLHARFGDKYRFMIDAGNAEPGTMTPALILQPLVENAVSHGFERKEGGEIRIKVEQTNEEVLLSVTDNGDGMPGAEIDKLFAEGEEDETGTSGIGLKNVMRRVILSTNGRGRLEIASTLGSGTAVTIHIPRQG
jgi:sensor histidine kinase YesM